MSRVLWFAALLALAPAQALAVSLTRLELVQQSVKTPGASYVTGFGLRFHLKGGEAEV